MSERDWFRNTEWTEPISRHFEKKLKRARRKCEYLRIQALTLVATHPEVALALTDRYLNLQEPIFHASAHWTRAKAYAALGRLDEAVSSYEATLACEDVLPSFKTTAALDYPFLIATRRLTQHFAAARNVLAVPRDTLQFPVGEFMRHASAALMWEADGNLEAARTEAETALQFADRTHSGLSRHQTVGLVSEDFAATIKELRSLVDA